MSGLRIVLVLAAAGAVCAYPSFWMGMTKGPGPQCLEFPSGPMGPHLKPIVDLYTTFQLVQAGTDGPLLSGVCPGYPYTVTVTFTGPVVSQAAADQLSKAGNRRRRQLLQGDPPAAVPAADGTGFATLGDVPAPDPPPPPPPPRPPPSPSPSPLPRPPANVALRAANVSNATNGSAASPQVKKVTAALAPVPAPAGLPPGMTIRGRHLLMTVTGAEFLPVRDKACPNRLVFDPNVGVKVKAGVLTANATFVMDCGITGVALVHVASSQGPGDAFRFAHLSLPVSTDCDPLCPATPPSALKVLQGTEGDRKPPTAPAPKPPAPKPPAPKPPPPAPKPKPAPVPAPRPAPQPAPRPPPKPAPKPPAPKPPQPAVKPAPKPQPAPAPRPQPTPRAAVDAPPQVVATLVRLAAQAGSQQAGGSGGGGDGTQGDARPAPIPQG